jgi:hypothetical protein
VAADGDDTHVAAATPDLQTRILSGAKLDDLVATVDHVGIPIGRCGRGATSQLRLEAKDGGVRVELWVHGHRRGERWRVVLVHERRVAWRGRARTRTSGSFRVRRSVPDFGGADQVTARASGPRGNTCQATASLAGA